MDFRTDAMGVDPAQRQTLPKGQTTPVAEPKKIDKEQLRRWMRMLQSYKAGKANLENRVIASENWWKLRNTSEENSYIQKEGDHTFKSKSAWLHNVIVNKHADMVEAFPTPNILPREEGDEQEAKMLTSIVPVVLEQNDFEEVYSDGAWAKCKSGTAIYKTVWDGRKLNGLGDISISVVSPLNLYWEPGVTDIQKSKAIFHTDLVDNEALLECYPQLEGKLKSNGFLSARFLYDDQVDTSNKSTVVEVYYKKHGLLHYCKFVGDTVLDATEDDPQMSQTGLYDHGLYPYEFDALYPVEGSPCGYGYIDVCKSPQTEIDMLKTAIVRNAMVACIPRFLSRNDGNINEEELLDLTKPVIHVKGNVDEASIRQMNANYLSGNYISVLESSISELRETSGNTEISAGSSNAGVTAASAIAALQEASGKSSRDATRGAYRCYRRIVNMVIELIRQFYDQPRQFRIAGQMGMQQYVMYSNQGIKPQSMGAAFGQELGMRLPVFDIKVEPQKRNAYTKLSQNEMAIQLYQLGVFNPQMANQTVGLLEMMDFDGKDKLMQKVQQNGTLMQIAMQATQIAMQFAPPEISGGLAMQAQQLGIAVEQPKVAVKNIAGGGEDAMESSITQKARKQAAEASQPT